MFHVIGTIVMSGSQQQSLLGRKPPADLTCLFLLSFSGVTITFKDLYLNTVVYMTLCCSYFLYSVASLVSLNNQFYQTVARRSDQLPVLGELKPSFSFLCGPTGKLSLQPKLSENVVINEILKHQTHIVDE